MLQASSVAETLKELNEAVKGSSVDEAPEELIRSNPGFLKQFTLVIATQVCCALCTTMFLAFTAHWTSLPTLKAECAQMREEDVILLDNICRAQGVLLLVARAYGLVGYVKVRCPGSHGCISAETPA